MSAHARDAYFRGPAGAAQPPARSGHSPAGLDEWVERDRSWGARWKASPVPAAVWDRVLLDPIRDILQRPGKAFRANLVQAAFALVEVDVHRRAPVGEGRALARDLAAALEILHAGSLIVDDIADQSLERRGAPCIHRIYGVPRALNAGNYMYFWALELLAQLELPPEVGRALQRRANSTLLDCHRGQALDLGLAIGGVAQGDVGAVTREISLLKTGALMSFAAYAGVAAASGTEHQALAAARFGSRLGVVLQQLDDLGNLTAKHAPGKRFEDLRWGRVTWPWAWAAETLDGRSFAALEDRSRRAQRAHDAQHAPRQRAPQLKADRTPSAAGSFVDRSVASDAEAVEAELAALAAELLLSAGLHRRAEIRAELARTLGELRSEFGDRPAVQALARDMERLEASYE